MHAPGYRQLGGDRLSMAVLRCRHHSPRVNCNHGQCSAISMPRVLPGTAVYRIEFDLPASGADNWELDLGDVRESARVAINGKPAANIWSVPYKAVVGEHLRPGRNLIEIEVTNLSANRIRDLDKRGVEWKIFYDINFVDHNYEQFDASGWEPVPSGLLGPVRLVPLSAYTPGHQRQ